MRLQSVIYSNYVYLRVVLCFNFNLKQTGDRVLLLLFISTGNDNVAPTVLCESTPRLVDLYKKDEGGMKEDSIC